MRRILKIVAVLAVAALLAWIISLSGAKQPTQPTPPPSHSSSMVPTTPSSTPADIKGIDFKLTADVVLHWYFDSPDRSVETPVDIHRYASAAFADPIMNQWDDLPSEMSVKIDTPEYPIYQRAPRAQEDGTVTLSVYVRTLTDYGDSSKDIDDTTAILTFVKQDGAWVVNAIDEIPGFAGEDEVP